MVSTDDAYVQADITILSAKISGYVASLAVDQQPERQGGRPDRAIDDGDYRLALQSAKDKLATQQSAIDRIGRQIEADGRPVTQAEAQVDAARADAHGPPPTSAASSSSPSPTTPARLAFDQSQGRPRPHRGRT